MEPTVLSLESMFCEERICIIVANFFITQIYATHFMVVVIHNYWNLDMNLTLFPPDFFHMALVLLVYSWPPPNSFSTSITMWNFVTKNTIPLSTHMIIKVPNESTLQNISLKLIWLSSIPLTFWPGHPGRNLAVPTTPIVNYHNITNNYGKVKIVRCYQKIFIFICKFFHIFC